MICAWGVYHLHASFVGYGEATLVVAVRGSINKGLGLVAAAQRLK